MKNAITFFVISLSLAACVSAPVSTPSIPPASSAPTEETSALIYEVQTLLNKKGYGAGSPDGIAGSKTRTAIKKFEKDKSLPVDGLVDDALYAALKQGNEKSVLAPNDKNTPTRVSLPRDRFWNIHVQNRLANATANVPRPPCVRAASPHHRKMLGTGFAALPQMA